MARAYWLVKSEPNVFSIDNLAAAPDKSTVWDGVRNYQARRSLRDGMREGDEVLFYHSRVEPMAVVGVTKVVREGFPDPSQFDPKHKYFDPDSRRDKPRWYAVQLQLVSKFKHPVTLASMRDMPELEGLPLLKKGSRLSVQPVGAEHFAMIVALGKRLSAQPKD